MERDTLDPVAAAGGDSEGSYYGDSSALTAEEAGVLDAEPGEAEYLDELRTGREAAGEEFRVRDQASADWVMNKLIGWQNEIDRREAAFKAEKKKLEAKIGWFQRRFGPQLEEFAVEQLSINNSGKTKQTKSFKLPCGGAIGYKKTPRHIVVEDVTEYRHWVMDNMPDVISDYVPQIDDREVRLRVLGKDDYYGTGEVPDGCHLVGDEDHFFIKLR